MQLLLYLTGVPISCRPFLPTPVLITGIVSVLFTLYDCNILLTSNMKFLNSTYLSVELQSNVGGCLNVGLPNLGAALVGSFLAPELPSLAATVKVNTAAFTASTAAYAMVCVIVV